jgi:hypothetical protein
MGRRWWIASLAILFAGICSSLPLTAARAGARVPSDSSFHAFARRRIGSLSTDELIWLGVQRRWRADEAQTGRLSGISSFDEPAAGPDDERFVRLASKPYAALADSERAWLVAASSEHEARSPLGVKFRGPLVPRWCPGRRRRRRHPGSVRRGRCLAHGFGW